MSSTTKPRGPESSAPGEPGSIINGARTEAGSSDSDTTSSEPAGERSVNSVAAASSSAPDNAPCADSGTPRSISRFAWSTSDPSSSAPIAGSFIVVSRGRSTPRAKLSRNAEPAPDIPPGSYPFPFMVVETWFGLVAIAFFGVLGTISLVTQIRRRSMITVSWRGIEESRMHGGRRVGTRTIVWEDVIAIAGVHVGGRWPSKGQYLVLLTLTPAACNRYRLGLPKWMRRLDAMNAGIIGPDAIALQRYDGGPHVMEDLLARVHRDVIGSRGFFG